MPKAELLTRDRVRFDDGSFVEFRVWSVPSPVDPSQHSYKYSCVYIIDGKRVIGYDNERGKGDHRHYLGAEAPYPFLSMERLFVDFLADVEKVRNDLYPTQAEC
jgi:hypothetical protein